METRVSEALPDSPPAHKREILYVATLLLIIVGALVVYKTTAAIAVIGKVQHTGTFQPRSNVVPLPCNPTQVSIVVRSINYFAVIWPALLFGILISGVVRVLNLTGPNRCDFCHSQSNLRTLPMPQTPLDRC